MWERKIPTSKILSLGDSFKGSPCAEIFFRSQKINLEKVNRRKEKTYNIYEGLI